MSGILRTHLDFWFSNEVAFAEDNAEEKAYPARPIPFDKYDSCAKALRSWEANAYTAKGWLFFLDVPYAHFRVGSAFRMLLDQCVSEKHENSIVSNT